MVQTPGATQHASCGRPFCAVVMLRPAGARESRHRACRLRGDCSSVASCVMTCCRFGGRRRTGISGYWGRQWRSARKAGVTGCRAVTCGHRNWTGSRPVPGAGRAWTGARSSGSPDVPHNRPVPCRPWSRRPSGDGCSGTRAYTAAARSRRRHRPGRPPACRRRAHTRGRWAGQGVAVPARRGQEPGRAPS